MKKIFCQGYLWLLLLLLYSPIIIIVVFSFTEAKVMGNWTGFSLQLYKNLFAEGTHHSLTAALINTVTIALITATVSTLFGTLTAIGIYNLRNRYARNAITFVNNIPILNGDIIIGISLFLLFITLGIPQGYTTVVLSHITFCLPYVILSVMPRLKQMNPNLYEAALDLGHHPRNLTRYDLWIHASCHHEHRRLRRDHIYHWKRGIGDALYLHICRCTQGRTNTRATTT